MFGCNFMSDSDSSLMAYQDLEQVGWREWVALPDIGIARIKTKVDTGARSSTLHAFDIEIHPQQDKTIVTFKVHPMQRNYRQIISARADLYDERYVRNSGGQTQLRPVILTTLCLGQQLWPIELTLTNRDAMGFRMLLGRQAIRHKFLVNPACSYLQGNRKASHPTR
jgi:hypothetical protein